MAMRIAMYDSFSFSTSGSAASASCCSCCWSCPVLRPRGGIAREGALNARAAAMDGEGGTVPSEAPEILVPEGVADADARSTLERLLGPELDAERRAAPLEYRVVEETRHHSQTPTQCEQRRAKKSEEEAWDVRALKLPLLLGARAEAEARQRILETIPHPLLAVARNGRVPPLDVACHRIKCMSECVLSPMFRPVVVVAAVAVHCRRWEGAYIF